MARPTIVVRIAFATDPFADTPTWTDVSADVMSFSIERGRQHFLDRIEAGTVYLVLKNSSGNYWPNNAAGDYYPNVLPGKRINIRATYSAVTYDLFTGFIESWEPGWLGASQKGATMRLTCSDLLSRLSAFNLNSAGYAEEVSGTRIGNMLDDLGWPAADRDLDTGQTTLQATGALANVNALDHLYTVQESEQGIVFIAGDGDVQFHDRSKRLTSPYDTSQATFGDDSGEMPYVDVDLSYDDSFIYNDVRITILSGTEQTSSDATSQGDYGTRTLNRSSLLMTTDNEAQDQADYLLGRFKDPALRAQSMTIYPDGDDANLYPKVLGYDVGTRITVRLNDASIDEDYHIEGISHKYEANQLLWHTTWQLSNASNQIYWALGTAGLSELGETTILFY